MVGKLTDVRCLCGEVESVKHVIMQCVIHPTARISMFSELLKSEVSLSLKSILNNKDYETTKAVVKFLHLAGLYEKM